MVSVALATAGLTGFLRDGTDEALPVTFFDVDPVAPGLAFGVFLLANLTTGGFAIDAFENDSLEALSFDTALGRVVVAVADMRISSQVSQLFGVQAVCQCTLQAVDNAPEHVCSLASGLAATDNTERWDR